MVSLKDSLVRSLGDYKVILVNRQIESDHLPTLNGATILNMDCAAAITTGNSVISTGYNQGKFQTVGTLALGLDALGNTSACVLGGTNYIYSRDKSLDVTTGDFSISLDVYYADWSTVGADQTIISRMDAAGDNGFKVYLATADQKIYLDMISGGVATATVSYDSSSAAAGWHTVGIRVARAVRQSIYFDGVEVASATDATDTMALPADVTKTISGIAILASGLVEVTTSLAHTYANGDLVAFTGIVGTDDLHGMDTLNSNTYRITSTAATKFTLDGIQGQSWDAWVSGGTVVMTPLMQLEIGSYGGGSDILTGRVDQIVYIKSALTADMLKVLYELSHKNLAVINIDGVVKEVSLT